MSKPWTLFAIRTVTSCMLLCTATVHAAPPQPKGAHIPPAPNPYVVADPLDPVVLHRAPGFDERGFDRGWMEKMARPPIPSAVLEELEALAPPRAVSLRLPEPGERPAAATVVRGNIMVVEGTADLVVNTQQGVAFNHNGAMFDIVNRVLSRLGDNFDFITVWTTFPDPNVAAYYFPLRNDTRGLGECNFNAGETFGCVFDYTDGLKLQGVVFMNSISYWEEWDRYNDGRRFSVDDFNSSLYATLGQEIAHRWGSALRFVDPRSGNVSKKLLGRDNSHWAAFVDTDASVMDGWDWARPVDGRFDLVNDMDNFSTLDLYTMGAVSVSGARPFFFIDDATFVESSPQLNLDGQPIPAGAVLGLGLPSVALLNELGIDLGAEGEKVDLTIQDIVDAEGNRCPDPDHTQQTFRQAFVLVTRTGQTAEQAQSDVEDLEVVAGRWEEWWSEKTNRALTLCSDLDAECEHAEVELGGGTIKGDVDGAIEPGSTITVVARPRAVGDTVKNARLVLTLDGPGAENTKLAQAEIPLGTIAEDEELEVPIEVSFDKDYDCDDSVIIGASVISDNAATVREEFRLFPGQVLLYIDNFAGETEFEVNADGEDRTTAGAFEQVDVELSCTMTGRTPERDVTPGSRGAFVTGADEELDGDTSLWSPKLDLEGTVDPVVAFDFWLDGEPGDAILVQLSDNGERWKDVFEDTQQIHSWGLGRVRIRDAFDGEIPASVTARFLFAGKGRLEGGIDNFRVMDAAGSCRDAVDGGPLGLGCGCTAEGSAEPQAGLAGMMALLGLRLRRRRAQKTAHA